VFVNVTKETIKLWPKYDPSAPITADTEERLRQYYESYWMNAVGLHK